MAKAKKPKTIKYNAVTWWKEAVFGKTPGNKAAKKLSTKSAKEIKKY